jgi:hypothetical protein
VGGSKRINLPKAIALRPMAKLTEQTDDTKRLKNLTATFTRLLLPIELEGILETLIDDWKGMGLPRCGDKFAEEERRAPSCPPVTKCCAGTVST